MGIVILAENQIYQFLVLIDQRKAVNLMLPDNVIRFFQRGLFLRIYKVIQAWS